MEDCVDHAACSGKLEVPSEREKEALASMKCIKDRVREIKGRLGCLETDQGEGNPQEIAALKAELAHLKEQWNRWEDAREEASRERMIILGHETP